MKSETEKLYDRVAKRGFSKTIERATVEAFTMADKASASSHYAVDTICHCGSCEDAYRAALRQYTQLREGGHCPYWMVQIAAATRQLALMDMLHHFDIKAEEISVNISSKEPNGGLTPERFDELELLMHIEMGEIADIESVMTAFNAQPEGSRGHIAGGEIVKEMFAVLDRIGARKGH